MKYNTWLEARQRSVEMDNEIASIIQQARAMVEERQRGGWAKEDFELAYGLSMLGVPPEQAHHMVDRVRAGHKVGMGMRW